MTNIKGDPPHGPPAPLSAASQEEVKPPSQRTVAELKDLFDSRPKKQERTAAGPGALPHLLAARAATANRDISDEESKKIAAAVSDPSGCINVGDLYNHPIAASSERVGWLTRCFYGVENAPLKIEDDICESMWRAFPGELKQQVQNRQNDAGGPMWRMYAEVLGNCSDEQLRNLTEPNTTYHVKIAGKTKSLRMDEILTLLAVESGNSKIFRYMATERMKPAYIDALRINAGIDFPICDVSCLMQGALVCAANIFESNPIRYSQLGASFIRHYCENIIDKSGNSRHEKTARKHKELQAIATETGQALLHGSKLVFEKGTDAQIATFLSKFSQQFGALSALIYQGSIEHAFQTTLDQEKLAKALTIILDVTIVAIAAVLATHAPPVVAFIPPAMTVVSTHIVPALVGKTDHVSAIQHFRGIVKASTAKELVRPTNPEEKSVPFEVIQQRSLYRDMFLSGWDIVPDLCAHR